MSTDLAPHADAADTSASAPAPILPAAPSTPAPPVVVAGATKAPRTWAKAKSTPEHFLAGAYFARRWERDGDGNDLSLCTETEFDAAIADVADARFVSAHQPIKG